MPKRYRVEISIYDQQSNIQVATTSHEEQYEDEEQAKQKFEEKKMAVHKAGKGSS